MDTLRALLYGVSSQRPSHSVFLGGQQLPLEARMGGIFLGFLCAVALVAVLGRLRASQSPGGWLALACWSLVALTGLDGLNAFLSDGNLPHLSHQTPRCAAERPRRRARPRPDGDSRRRGRGLGQAA